MLEGKSMPSNMAADTNHANFVVKSKYHKISPLNEFPLKFRVQDNFYVLCQFLASARLQLTVEGKHWSRDLLVQEAYWERQINRSMANMAEKKKVCFFQSGQI